MPSARAMIRGAFLKARFMENGMKYGEFSSVGVVPTASGRALSFMTGSSYCGDQGSILARPEAEAYSPARGQRQ
jgi:hypothetical protein